MTNCAPQEKRFRMTYTAPLQNKTALITGAAQGIGFAIAHAFLEAGARVGICDIQPENTQKATDALNAEFGEGRAIAIVTDVTSQESIHAMAESAMEAWGRIDIHINNAGITSTKHIFEMDNSDFTRVLDINLLGPFMAIREIGPIMKEQGGGSIINTSSMVGTYGGKMQTAYSSSKFAVNGLTKSCAKELGQFNIRVNAVAPGVVATPMMKDAVDDRTLAFLEQVTPLGHAADPSELAGAYVYLASDAASFTTGTIIHVDGGIVM